MEQSTLECVQIAIIACQVSGKTMNLMGHLESMKSGNSGKPGVDFVSTQEMFKSEQIKVKQLIENLH